MITPRPLTSADFAPFGDVIAPRQTPDMIINQGKCARHHDLAQVDFGAGRAGISLFDAQGRDLPLQVDLLERHPLGSQAFLPLNAVPMIVVVAEGAGDVPGKVHAFLSAPGQGINLHRGTWHGVLAPLGGQGLYAVVDRIGDGNNLQEYWLEPPVMIGPPA